MRLAAGSDLPPGSETDLPVVGFSIQDAMRALRSNGVDVPADAVLTRFATLDVHREDQEILGMTSFNRSAEMTILHGSRATDYVVAHATTVVREVTVEDRFSVVSEKERPARAELAEGARVSISVQQAITAITSRLGTTFMSFDIRTVSAPGGTTYAFSAQLDTPSMGVTTVVIDGSSGEVRSLGATGEGMEAYLNAP